MADLVEAAKKAALQAIEASKPSGVYFGTVINDSPLEIDVEQKMILESAQLILTRNVTEYDIEMTVEHETEEEDEHTHEVDGCEHTSAGQYPCEVTGINFMETKSTEHLHKYEGKKTFTVHNGLVKDEKVILLRVQGGQKYVVWDRIT